MNATFVRELDDMRGSATLWKLSEPYTLRKWDDETGQSVEYIVTSAVEAPFSGPETYVFPANEAGEIVDWGDLPGSFRGSLDQVKALHDFMELT